MRRLRADGNQVQHIAWAFGVAATCVSGVVNRRTHTRVPDQPSAPHEMDTMSLFEIHDYSEGLRQPKRDAERKREQRRRSLAGTR